MARHSTLPSTVPSDETWRHEDRETILSSPRLQPMEMTSLSNERDNLIRGPNLDPDLGPDFTETDRLNKGKGKAVSPATIASSEAPTHSLTAGILPAELASPLPVIHEDDLNIQTAWPEPSHLGTSWVPDDTSSHNQGFLREARTPNLRNQIQRGIETGRQVFVRELDAQSHASFRGARSIWPLSPKFPPQPATPSSTPIPSPIPVLPTDHPILRLPSPTPPHGPLIAFHNPSHLHPNSKRPSLSWTDATFPGTDCALSKQGTIRKPKTGRISSLLGVNKYKSNANPRPIISGPMPSTLQSTSMISMPAPPSPPALDFVLFPPESERTGLSLTPTPTNPGTATPAPGIDRWASLIAARGISPGEPRDSRGSQSFYSGYWQDNYGGRIHYDHHRNIKDVEFEDGADVRLDTSEV